MSNVTVTRVIDFVSLWKVMFSGELEGSAALYQCRMRTNYEPGEFTMVHPKEYISFIRNPGRLYIMLKPYTSSRGAIPNDWKCFIEYGGATRKTLYQAQMPAPLWVELLEHVNDSSLDPLLDYYAGMANDGEAVRLRIEGAIEVAQ